MLAFLLQSLLGSLLAVQAYVPGASAPRAAARDDVRKLSLADSLSCSDLSDVWSGLRYPGMLSSFTGCLLPQIL